MLWFERQVVATLAGSLDGPHRQAVEDFVDGALAAQPQHIRAGVAAESLVLGAWARLTPRRRGQAGIRLEPLESSPLMPVRQYVRLLRSLVLFAQHELAPGAGG